MFTKKIKIISWIIIVVILSVGIYITFQIINDWGEGEPHGSQTVRNCIASVLGNKPQCSDDNGQLEETYINGLYLGVVTSVPGACWSNPATNLDCQPYIKKLTKEQRLTDPNLLYASTYWAGLCSNDKGEGGGCYDELYLYSNGDFIRQSGFIKYNESSRKEENPIVQGQLSSAVFEQIIKKIKDSDVMTKECKPSMIMDVGWDHQIRLDGVKRSFHNVPTDCRDTFDEIDNIINAVAENK